MVYFRSKVETIVYSCHKFVEKYQREFLLRGECRLVPSENVVRIGRVFVLGKANLRILNNKAEKFRQEFQIMQFTSIM